MKLKHITVLSLIIAIVLIYKDAQTFMSRGFGESTGAPIKSGTYTFFANFKGCNVTGCHFGNDLNKPGGNLEIFTNIPNSGWEPNTEYEVALKVTYPNTDVFGFQFTAWGDVDSVTVGDIGPRDSSVGITESTVFDFSNTPVGKLKYATHVSPAIYPKSVLAENAGEKWWSFTWKSPAIQNQNITFFATANASNGNGQITGDNIYKTSLSIGNGSPLSVAHHSQIASFNVFPNPVTDKLNIDINTVSAQKTEVNLYNIEGKIVLSKKLNGANNYINEVLDCSSLNKGIYFLSAKSGNETKTLRVVKL